MGGATQSKLAFISTTTIKKKNEDLNKSKLAEAVDKEMKVIDCFQKMGQSRPLFVYFRYFLIRISIIQIEKSVDGMLGI